jgi:glucans biosynthesis protein C
MEPVQRYHALDALRASMMLLGIVLHAMASYTTLALGEAWPLKDPQTSQHFNLPLFVIHIFRMPAFFVMAGFFAALLYERGGLHKLIVNRTKRVLLPFVVFWVALAPLVVGGFLFAMHQGLGMPVSEIIAANSRMTPISTMHLWFLYFLLIFYAASIVVILLARGRQLRPGVCRVVTTTPGSVLLWTTLTTLTLLPMALPGIEGSTLLLPPIRTLVAYGVFFFFGWLLFVGRDSLDALRGSLASHLALGAFGVVAYIYIYDVGKPFANPRTTHVAACAAMALSMWGFVLGITGAFLRLASREHPVVRYLSGAAYWTYLVHLPIVIVVAGALARAPLHAFVKFSLVLIVTTAASLATYHYFVRSTVIGKLLNGIRQPGRLKPAPTVPAA